MARPCKLTPEVQDVLTALLRSGNTRRVAATAAGISETRFYEWMKAGDVASRGQFREFREAVERAEAECEVLMVESIRKAARGYEESVTSTKTMQREILDANGKPKRGADGKPITEPIVEVTVKHGVKFDPRMALEWLSRRRPADWGNKVTQEHTGPNGGAAVLNLTINGPDITPETRGSPTIESE